MWFKEIPGKGKGAFASRAYSEGEEIYREKPLVWVPFHWPFSSDQLKEVEHRVYALSAEDQETFFAMSNAYTEGCDVSKGQAPSVVAGIWYTNSFDMADAYHGTSCAMYCAIARLNHNCKPNTRQEFDKGTLEEVCFALPSC
jgi:hypothetical protein